MIRFSAYLLVVTIIIINMGSSCAQAPGQRVAISASEQQQIIAAHEAVRNKVSPPSKNMPGMTWDDNLAKIWPEQNAQFCKFEHFNGRSKVYGGYVGENLYASGGLTIDYTKFINSWAGEDKDYSYGQFTDFCTPGAMCGHYTQLIWASSTKIGCARFDCKGVPGAWGNLFVCNYSPGGNFYGKFPYEEASARGTNNTGTTCKPKDNPCNSVSCGAVDDGCGKLVQCDYTCGTDQFCEKNTCKKCASVCGQNGCGNQRNPCFNNKNGGTEECGGCEDNKVCEDNQCHEEPTCVPTITSPQTHCTGEICGQFNDGCGYIFSCNCSSSDATCEFGKCVIPPKEEEEEEGCKGKCNELLFETCIEGAPACECMDGYLRSITEGACVPQTTSALNWEQITPKQDENDNKGDWVLAGDETNIEMVSSTNNEGKTRRILKWKDSEKYSSDEETIFESEILINDKEGDVGLGMRLQSSEKSYLLWKLSISENIVKVIRERSDSSSLNTSKSPLYSTWKANDYNKVIIKMNDNNDIEATNNYSEDYMWFSITINGEKPTRLAIYAIPKSSFPESGAVFFYTQQYAAFRNTRLFSQSTLLVTFSGCLSESELQEICDKFGADDCLLQTSTCSPSNDDNNNNISNSSSTTNRREVVGSTAALVTFTSFSGVSAKAQATQFSQAAKIGDVRFNGYQVSSVTKGTPINSEAIDMSQVSIEGGEETITETVEGTGENGLSGGAIAGIAVGGGVLLIAAVIVTLAAIGVAVAAIVARKKKQKKLHQDNEFKMNEGDIEMKSVPNDNNNNSNNNNNNNNNNISAISRGPDLFAWSDDDEDTNKHRSITARIHEGSSQGLHINI